MVDERDSDNLLLALSSPLCLLLKPDLLGATGLFWNLKDDPMEETGEEGAEDDVEDKDQCFLFLC